ncbi:hypothetical protein HZA97_09180 [Candidatus Woesearchaeota archaeon]|nr:hypothetical protein [Candidatus Woesearchaeota archaeon]
MVKIIDKLTDICANIYSHKSYVALGAGIALGAVLLLGGISKPNNGSSLYLKMDQHHS